MGGGGKIVRVGFEGKRPKGCSMPAIAWGSSLATSITFYVRDLSILFLDLIDVIGGSSGMVSLHETGRSTLRNVVKFF